MKEIKEEAERVMEIYFKHAKGQTDDVRMIHAKQCALIYCDGVMSVSLCENCNLAVERHWTEVKEYIQNNY